jgi:uncharacterized protein YxjI
MQEFFGSRGGIGLHQKRKFLELRNQYTLTDEEGKEIGKVEQKKQSPLAFILRLATSLDVALPVTLHVTDTSGEEVLNLHKPWFRWGITVSGGGRDLGKVQKQLRVGKATYEVTGPDGQEFAHLKAENWRAKDFKLEDSSGGEVGRITKQWRGLVTEMFTDADSYAVTFAPESPVDSKALALASALAVDLIQKQKDTN